MNSKKRQRRRERKKQLKINNQLKRRLYKNVFIAPCCYCRNAFLMDELTIEHVVPRSLGGTNNDDNIALACGPCNHARGRKTQFARRQKKQMEKPHDKNNPTG